MGCRNQAKTQRGQKCTAHLLAWKVYQAASCAQWLTNDCMMMEFLCLLTPVLQFLACGSLTSCLSLAPRFVFHQNSGCQSVWHSRQQHAGAKLAHNSLLWGKHWEMIISVFWERSYICWQQQWVPWATFSAAQTDAASVNPVGAVVHCAAPVLD
jgi:hypothetical protein